jgi:hypothetical protein
VCLKLNQKLGIFYLQIYAKESGPYQTQAAELYEQLKTNVIKNVFKVSDLWATQTQIFKVSLVWNMTDKD